MPAVRSSIVIRPRNSLLATSLAVAGGLYLSACAGEPLPDTGTVSVAVAPASVSVAQGGSGTSAVTVARGGAFTGPVTLTQTGAPAGVVVAFAPAVVPAGSTTSTATITAGAAVATGTYPISIRASGDNVPAALTNLAVVVVGGAAGSIALTAAPTALTVPVGGAAVTSVITIARTAPFAGPVELTVTGQPAGVTATLTPTSATGTTSTLSVQATTGAVNGAYPLVIQGAGTGIAAATTTVTATVTGGATTGVSFTFTPSSVPVTVGGGSATSAVLITRTNFLGGVNLAISGAPTGMSASVNPNTNLSGTAATVSVQAGAAVAPGTYNLTLTGTGTGIPNATGILPVVVSPASGGGSASVTFCIEDAPLWVASQDGNGAWTAVAPTTVGGTTYQFTFASGKGGIATVQSDVSGTDLSVLYGTLADFTAFAGTVNNNGCESNKVVNGSVSGVGATEAAIIDLGGSAALVVPPATGFALTSVPGGLRDLVATRVDASTLDVNWIILRRSLNTQNNDVLPPLTFGTEGFASVSANVDVTNLGADAATVGSVFTGVRGSSFVFLSSIPNVVTATPAQPYAAIPTAQLNAGELQEVVALASDAGNPNSDRSAGVYFTTVADRTIALGPSLNAPTVTKTVTGGIARPRVQLAGQAEYDRYISATYTQAGNRAASVFATAAFFGGLPTTWDVTIPDLSTVAGWTAAWGLQDGTPINWDVSASGGAITFLDPTISDGSTTRGATVSSSAPLALRGRNVLAGRIRGPLH